MKYARSYGGTEMDSDHKLVKMEMEIDWRKVNNKKKKVERIDVNSFSNPAKKEEYRAAIKHATVNIQTENQQ